MLADRPLIIVYDGKGITHLFTDGKVYGDGITGILFEHKGLEFPKNPDISVKITADDVNIIGKDGADDIYTFRNVINRIIENAPRE